VNLIRVVIADDHPLLRAGLAQVVSSERDIVIVGEASDGEEAAKMVNSENPDIAILDLEMPKKSGLTVIRELRKSHSFDNVKIIILSMHKEKDIFDEAMSLRVKGYLLKDSALIDIIKAIRLVHDGNYFISPELSEFLLLKTPYSEKARSIKLKLELLTPAEYKILKLIGDKKSTCEISQLLFISPKTVETHRSHISEKLNLKGPNNLIKFALEMKDML